MQEPTLFNYTIKENILYGSTLATNTKILESAQIANATEFIENSQMMEDLVDDSPQGLLKYYSDYKGAVLEKLSKETYERHV